MFRSLINRFFPRSEPHEESSPFDALGHDRNGIIWAQGFMMRDDPMIVSPPGPGDDLVKAYLAYAGRARAKLERVEPDGPTEWYRRSMIGVLQLTTGDLRGADAILDNLPPERIVLDHGAGTGWLVPTGAILNTLPLAETKPTPQDLIAGSEAEREVREWLGKHRDQLVWHEVDGLWKLRN